jgi:hypothetical protein
MEGRAAAMVAETMEVAVLAAEARAEAVEEAEARAEAVKEAEARVEAWKAAARKAAGARREALEGLMVMVGEKERPVQAEGSVVEAAFLVGARATARGASHSRCSRLLAHRPGTRLLRHRRRMCRPTSSREWSTHSPSSETSTAANTRLHTEPASEETAVAATAMEKSAGVV